MPLIIPEVNPEHLTCLGVLSINPLVGLKEEHSYHAPGGDFY